ncbi:hypothetical protein BGX31_010079 [Mortierella sp. GBA43]|nr:hypothetical protein BGX31_010079 [Mortierella sp. GBA43]
MGYSRTVSVHAQSTGLPHPIQRSSSFKAPPQTRWPVSLNQLTTLSLDEDSDLDRSFTDEKGSKGGVGSVKLLRMLKDSDDESNSGVSTQSKLKRPMSAYSGLQMPQQRSQQQKGLAPVARSSSMRVSGAQAGGQSAGALPIPQRTKSDTKGPSTPTGIARPMGLPLAGPKRQQNDVADNPEDMERIFSEANAIAKRLSSSAVQSRSGAPGLRAPGVKGEPVVVVVRKAGLPSPTGVPVPGGQQVKSRLSAPPRAAQLQEFKGRTHAKSLNLKDFYYHDLQELKELFKCGD